MADKKEMNEYLQGDIPCNTGDEYPYPKRDADRYVCLGSAYRDAYADDKIYYDREHDRFVEDIYTWGVVDDADHRYHGMEIKDREWVIRNTYYPSKVFAEILGTMPVKYYKPPKPPKLEPEKPKENVLLVWPAIRGVMKTYYKLGDTDDREVADYYREILEYATALHLPKPETLMFPMFSVTTAIIYN